MCKVMALTLKSDLESSPPFLRTSGGTDTACSEGAPAFTGMFEPVQGPMTEVGLGLLSLRRTYPVMHDTCSQYLARVCSLSLYHSESTSAERNLLSTVFKLLLSPLSCTSFYSTCCYMPVLSVKTVSQLFWRLAFTAEKKLKPTTFLLLED